jgi:Cas6b C-terminal domain/Cas6b N-terminal domain
MIRILHVAFDTEIRPWEIPWFRGAMARKVGLEHEWFHNHNNETGGYHQRYPLLQYKIDPERGLRRPMLLCLEEAVEEAHHFFGQPDWSLRIGDRQHDLRIAKLRLDQHHLSTNTDRNHTFKIHKWIALNDEYFARWQRTDRLADRYALLEELLVSHIFAFARGVGWAVEQRLEVRITELLREEWVEYKNVKMLAFTLVFKANANLPDLIGLGKGVSIGFGILRKQRAERP